MRRRATRVALFASLTLEACGGAPPHAEPTIPAGMGWDAMDREQRSAFMRFTVMPRMKALFMELDPHRYAKMGCIPCHTRDRTADPWKMPNPDLLLDPSCRDGTGVYAYGSESYAEAMKRMNRFMLERVQPEMAALLGRRPYDPATREGFDCFGCHTPERPRPRPTPPP